MADSYVCSGATMKCTMGEKTAKLTVLPNRTVFLCGQPMANISDHKSMVNLAPFGRCRSLGYPATAAATAAHHGHLTPMPCVHNTPIPWMNGKTDYIIKGQPALLKSCKCQCMWGGTISIIQDGQNGGDVNLVSKIAKGNFQLYDAKTYSTNNVTLFSKPNNSQSNSNNTSDVDIIALKESAKIVIAWFRSLAEHQKAKLKETMAIISDKTNLEKIVKVAKIFSESPSNFSFDDKIVYVRNCLELENKTGITKNGKMSTSKADKQNANPKFEYRYIADPNGTIEYNGVKVRENPNYKKGYTINCATCAAAYALRKRGFDVKAKSNDPNTLNEVISKGTHWADMWKNKDGSDAKPTSTTQWMQDNNIKSMTIDDYKKFFNDTCADEGIYTLNLSWKTQPDPVKDNGHATILQRDKDGKLYYIEPQVYESDKTKDGRRSIDDLLISSNGELNLNPNPPSSRGILRVDDKLFDPEYATLFE